ncbi:hypothetical protein CK203_065768 [Vitis vinifera]|uniref:DUF4218 domain-containing protein n=1 Tax=Vitis vinifera TaxID=29760 RepID=A0A438GCS7_VITVI|nr:hypothetical protein CK203_065768 [Vitis vinifera]
MKCLNGWSNKSFTMLLELLKETLLEEHANANECVVCGVSRWKSSDDHSTDEFTNSVKKKKIPAKVLRYFPLKPRLQRLYMSSKTASHMKWHVDGRMEGEMMRHPVDSLAWKNFDNVHPSFALEPRNVRLGLASDGFNPFGNMSISYSMWPGWSTKGKFACPICNKDCSSIDYKTDGNGVTWVIVDFCRLIIDFDVIKSPLMEMKSIEQHLNNCLGKIIVGTLLSIDGKSKDNFNSRLDLQAMGIRDQLHPIQRGNRVILPAACYSLTSNEKKEFCKFLKEVKVPDGYASNISRCVQVNERKIFGLKSHDCHVLMQQLLPLAIRGVLHKNVCAVIVELCSFFKQLCSKVLKTDQLEHLENDIIVTLCKLERIFPPSFFDVMVHLPIHLASEAKVVDQCNIDGCILSSGMYLRTLKSYVRNKSRPEGSIAEGEHKQSIRVKPRIRARDVDLIHTREFISWFEERISHKRTRKGKKNQNSGVVVTIEVSSFASARDKNPIPGHVSYYGVLTDEMSHRRGRVQIVSPEDELDNLQQLLDIQPAATTTPSSSDPSDSSDPSVVGSSSSKKRTRGPTRNLDLLSMKPGEKKTTRFNTRGQVVYDGKGERLSSYMGTLVRSQHNVPIQVQDWNHVSEDVKEKIWALVLMRRDCAIDLHTYHDDWRWLIHFWGTPEAKMRYILKSWVERHGRVRGYGFGPTPTSIFGSTSRRRSGVILSTQLENAQEMLIARTKVYNYN